MSDVAPEVGQSDGCCRLSDDSSGLFGKQLHARAKFQLRIKAIEAKKLLIACLLNGSKSVLIFLNSACHCSQHKHKFCMALQRHRADSRSSCRRNRTDDSWNDGKSSRKNTPSSYKTIVFAFICLLVFWFAPST